MQLTKPVQALYAYNCKMLMEEFKEDLNGARILRSCKYTISPQIDI